MPKKFLLFLLCAIVTTLLGADIDPATKAQLMEAIKANPALLDSPEAKQFIKQQKGTTATTPTAVSEQPFNDINTTKKFSARNSMDFNRTEDINSTEEFADTTPKKTRSIDELLKNPLHMKCSADLFKDLVTRQIKESKQPLTRYGEEFFSNKNKIDLAALPVPDHYKITPKDTLSIVLYGPRSDNLSLTVDKDGTIIIPAFGPLRVAGLTFKEAKRVITNALAQAYPNVGVAVNITQFSTIQVVLAGEVEAPGVYNVSSFSTVKDALIAAGGVGKNGSMRDVIVKRGNRILKHIDLYRIIRDGDRRQELLLEASDTIVVQTADAFVKLDGFVKRPAIFEPKKGETLADILYYAGGITADASRYDLKIKRYNKNRNIEIISVTLDEAKKTTLYDGDEVYVYNLDEANLKSVTLYGNIIRPGAMELPKEGMTLQALLAPLIKEKTMRGVFLEETLFDYALIRRITPDLQEKLISFNLEEALSGKTPLPLYSRDEIYIFNRNAVYPTPYVKIGGECIAKPGKLRYIPQMTLIDAINAAGLSCPIDEDSVTIISHEPLTFTPSIRVVNFKKNPFHPLNERDEIQTISILTTNPERNVTISGEVYKPGTFPIGQATTMRELILAAGGPTDKASPEKVELVRYVVKNGQHVRTIQTYTLDQALGENSPVLQNYDEVTLFRIPRWNERKTVKLYGKVRYPGEYTIEDGDTLNDLLKRAGGFTPEAFIEGAVFTRKDVKKLQEEGLKRQLKELEQRIITIAATPVQAGETQQAKAELSTLLANLKAQAENIDIPGRITMKLDHNLSRIENSPYDITLKDGDALYVPELENSVVVMGEIMNPSAIIHTPGLTFNDYINKAGGLKESTDEGAIFVIHANGEAERVSQSFFFASGTNIGPGDTIVVPMKIRTYSGMQFAKDITAIIYQLAVSVAAIKTIGSI
ncbi:MAG: SLBB domain-containing protein [Campylobacterales bacterium]